MVEAENFKASLRVHRQQVPEVAARLLSQLPVADFSVTDPPLESVIDQIYRKGIAS